MRNLRAGYVVGKTFSLFIVLLFSSCLTINSSMKLNSNGSGTLTLEYIIDSGLNGIGTLGDNKDVVPLNLSEEYISQMIGDRNDIEYYDYSINDSSKNRTVSVSFRFDSVEAVNVVLPEENRIKLTREGNSTIFYQSLIEKKDISINGDSLEILKDIYKENSFTMEVRVPGEISDIKNGKKVDERVALYHESFLDVITDNSKKEWSIRW